MALTRKTPPPQTQQAQANVKAGASVSKAAPKAPEEEVAQGDAEYEEETSSPEDLVDQAIAEAKDNNWMDPGTYEAILTECKTLPATDKGISIMTTFIIADEEHRGFRHVVFMKMYEADLKTPHEWGPYFYNQMMGKLGYEKAERGKEARAQLTEDKPGVVIKLTASKGGTFGPNTVIMGRLDDENENIIATREYMETVDPLA